MTERPPTSIMQDALAPGPVRVERLASPVAVEAAVRRLGAAPGAVAERGLAVTAGDRPVLVLGLRRLVTPAGLRVGRLSTLTVSPVLLDPAGGPAAMQAVLRELFIGESGWHVLRVVDAPGAFVDAAWRFAARLGHASAIVQEPPPARTPDGEVTGGQTMLSVYSPRLKGRWARAADSGVPAVLGAATRERLRALTRRLPGIPSASEPETGSRFFVLDLAAVSAAPSWGAEVSFVEIAAAEAAEQPLRYSTGVRRLEESLRRGDRCFATLVDGVLAHHHWVSRDPNFLRRMLPPALLDRPTGHPFDSYTFPAYRGRRLQAITHHWLALRYRDEGVARFAVRISAFNAASLRGIQKAGYVEVPAAGAGAAG